MANILKLSRNGAVGFINWLDLLRWNKLRGVDIESAVLPLITMFDKKEVNNCFSFWNWAFAVYFAVICLPLCDTDWYDCPCADSHFCKRPRLLIHRTKRST